MGLLDRLRGMKDPVLGTYRLVACSYSTGGAVYENCTMDGVVEAPGVAPTAVHHVSLITPVAKWPQPGTVLPVLVDRGDPSRITIQWKGVPSTAQLARAAAERAAADAAGRQAADGVPHPESPMPPDFVMPPGAGAAAGVEAAGGRPMPGTAGGGLTPAEAARATAGSAAALGLIATTATVLAAHPALQPGTSDPAPGGTWDLTLDVTGTTAGTGWTSVLRIGFSSPARHDEIARIGRTLPVLADPARHDRIAVDTSRIP